VPGIRVALQLYTLHSTAVSAEVYGVTAEVYGVTAEVYGVTAE